MNNDPARTWTRTRTMDYSAVQCHIGLVWVWGTYNSSRKKSKISSDYSMIMSMCMSVCLHSHPRLPWVESGGGICRHA